VLQIEPMSNRPLYAFYGHHKCATMWWNRIIANVCRKTGLTFKPVYDERGFNGDLKRFAEQQEIDFLSHGNADMDHIAGLGEHRGVHIIRDPRDIAVSAYFSHLHSHSTKEWSELEEYREKLRAVSPEKGLEMEIRNRQKEFSQIESWDYAQPNILEIRFEEMAQSSYDLVVRVFRYYELIDESDYRLRNRVKELGLDLADGIFRSANQPLTRGLRPGTISGAELLGIAWKFRFQSLAGGRKQGSEDVRSHFRKGRPGDWVNHFNAGHKALFRELYPDLLTKLGYESSSDW
jgi:hypothetical protein